MGRRPKIGRPREPLPRNDNPNRFARWLVEAGMDIETLARLLGVSSQSIYAWRAGRRKPSTDHVIRIEEITDGRVSARDWRDVLRNS